MNLNIKLAFRFLSGKSSYFLSFSNLIAFFGIVIGLFSLLVVSSVMNGLSLDMARRIVSAKGEVRVYMDDFSPFTDHQSVADSLRNVYPEILAVGPVNHNEVLLRRRHLTAYSENFGVDFEEHLEISDIFNNLVIGVPDADRFRNNGIVLGLDLSWQLNASVGDSVDVVSPSVLLPTPLGLVPMSERFRVVGIFQSGLPEFDRLYSFIDIDKSRLFQSGDGVDYLEIKTDLRDLNFRPLVNKIERDFPLLRAEHWEIFDRTLFEAIKIEKIAMFVVMAIILVLASFNIMGNFIRTVTEKKEEIALLNAIGMNRKDIFVSFIIMGLIVGVSGILIADILAVGILYLQKIYGFVEIPVPGFPFTTVPVDINIGKILSYSLLALLICLAGSFYPAYKTLKINLIEVIKD